MTEMPDLPELPEEGMGDRMVILFRVHDVPVVLAEYVLLEDAREYASRDDTHGEGWFVGFDRA